MTIDWDSFANNRPQRETYRGRVERQTLEKSQQDEQLALLKSQTPAKKAALSKAILEKTPIKVLQPFQNPTVKLSSELNKSQDAEDDGFYYSGGSTTGGNDNFEETIEVIPAGTELVFKSWQRTMGQFIFEDANGQEYEIYDQPNVQFKGRAIPNTGLQGLLWCTDL